MTNPVDNIPKEVLGKLQKLMNLRDGAEAVGSLAEAENASARIQQMLFKYNLDLDDVKNVDIQKRLDSVKIVEEGVDLTDAFDKRETEWVPKLYVAVADNFLCKCFWYSTRVTIVGKPHNIAFVCYLCDQLIAKIRIAEKLSWKGYDGGEKRGTYRRGFYVGSVSGIYYKLKSELNKAHSADNPFAVMVVKEDKDLEDYLIYGTNDPHEIKKKQEENKRILESQKQRILDMTPEEGAAYDKEQRKWSKKRANRKGPRQTKSNAGWEHGYEAGKNMEINKGVEEGSKAKNYIQ